MKNLIGVGIMLETPDGTYLLQERDHNTKVHPGRIAPFGGGIEEGETAIQCAQRELIEELSLEAEASRLESIGFFTSHSNSDNHIEMFLVKGVGLKALDLQEGKSIIELSKEDALKDPRLTDFTKEVLRSI